MNIWHALSQISCQIPDRLVPVVVITSVAVVGVTVKRVVVTGRKHMTPVDFTLSLDV